MARATSEGLTFEKVERELSDPLRRYLERLTGDRSTARTFSRRHWSRSRGGYRGSRAARASRRGHFQSVPGSPPITFVGPTSKAQNRRLLAKRPSLKLPIPTSGDRLVIDEMSACVRGVIDGLPGDYRTALVLHDLEGLTAAQVAEVAGCSLANAKVRIHRARRRLKDRLWRTNVTFYRDDDNVFRCDRNQ